MTWRAGLPVEIEPLAALTAEDYESIDSFVDPGSPSELPTTLRIVDQKPFDADFTSFPEGGASELIWEGDTLRVSHNRFLGLVRPRLRTAEVYRRADESFVLSSMFRASLIARLPFEGGLPLHAASTVIDGKAVIFFGVSGAGKSTLSSTSPFPLLSDELTAVLLRGAHFLATASGHWGTFSVPRPFPGQFPISALIGLKKAPTLSIRAIDRRDALRHLLQVVLVPPGTMVWQQVISNVASLSAAVPCYEMAWSPRQPPWDEVRELISNQR